MKNTRNFWPLGIILFFVLFFCAMATVVVIAETHRETMVSENYYEQELKYQDRINAVNRAVNCGVTITSDASNKSVVIALPAVQVAQNISGSIQLYRPSAPALDQKVRLEPKADGTQRLDTSRLAAGLWVVRVKWVAGGENYFLEQKITGAGK